MAELSPLLYEALKTLVEFEEPVPGWWWGYTPCARELMELGLVKQDMEKAHYLPTPKGIEAVVDTSPAAPMEETWEQYIERSPDTQLIKQENAAINALADINLAASDELASLRARVVELEADIQRIYAALLPHIAGGSEYTGVSGIIRGITEVAGQRDRHWERIKKLKTRKDMDAGYIDFLENKHHEE